LNVKGRKLSKPVEDREFEKLKSDLKRAEAKLARLEARLEKISKAPAGKAAKKR
jgi:hypothetical protein